jgi:hypothetical protein
MGETYPAGGRISSNVRRARALSPRRTYKTSRGFRPYRRGAVFGVTVVLLCRLVVADHAGRSGMPPLRLPARTSCHMTLP